MDIAATIEGDERKAVAPSHVPDARTLPDVFRVCADGLYRYIVVRIGGDRDAADDLLQQTCLEAMRSKRRPSSASDYERWLCGIARNLVAHHRRKTARNGKVVSIDGQAAAELLQCLRSNDAPALSMVDREQQQALLLAVTELDAADQDLLYAFYFRGGRQSEIAGALGVSVKGVESRLYRARNRLRTKLVEFARENEP